MKSEESARLAYTLDHLTVGAAILDGASLRILYANASILSFLSEPWLSEGIIGHTLAEVASPELLPTLQFQLGKAYLSGERQTFSDVAYEGFLGTRGRTYWHITIEPLPKFQMPQTPQTTSKRGKPKMALLVTVEDVTAQVRSRLQLKAIHYITSVITDPYALPQVLDRILQTVQEMIGSTRCAILLQDRTSASRTGEQLANARVNSIQVAAHKGLHASARTWRPLISSNVLYKRVSQMNQTLIISDTSQEPDLQLPMVNDDGEPARPLSVLSVPIFEPTSQYEMEEDFYLTPDTHLHTREVVGTIEVYHRKVRSFAAEEVELLEQFSLQAGIAIRNTRIFRSIDQLAARASRNARQREKVLQAIPDGVIIYDARWRIIDVNDAIRKVMGWTNDVIGKHVSTAFKQSKAIMPALATISSEDLAREYEQRALEQQINEIKLIGADGQPYTMRRSQAAIRDELGDVFAFVAVYHDVTEQAKARERIEEEVTNRTAELAQRNKALQRAKRDLELESARMQLLLERLPSGVMLISSYDSRISMINHQAVQLLQDMGILLEPQHDLEEATRNAHGKNIESLLRSITMYRSSASPFPYEEQPLYQALTEGKAGEAEFFVIGPFQQPLFVLANAAPLRASDGTITNVVLLCHNITRMKLLEQTREDFFTAMAHELKTPLANIRAHLSALQIRDIQPSPEEQTLFINTADEQAERLVRMINQFLDASRVEAGALRLTMEPILIPEMFEDLEERLEALISNSGRRLEKLVPPHLPAIAADYEAIMSVLTNLLSNAFRYAPKGDRVLLEARSVARDGANFLTEIEILVSDRGPGLSEEQQAELFTRFRTFTTIQQRGDDQPGRRQSETRWSPSSGLGLYISRGIIEAHGSHLTLQSRPGAGATFAFTLAIANPAHLIDDTSVKNALT